MEIINIDARQQQNYDFFDINQPFDYQTLNITQPPKRILSQSVRQDSNCMNIQATAALKLGILNIYFDMKLVKLLLIKTGRSIKHNITSTVVFREGDAVADRVEACQYADKAVKAKGKTSMWRRTILKCIHEEAELCLGTFRCKA